MPPKKALAKAQEKVISDIAATIGMRETEIVFPEKDDMIFMGQNIFGHDFIHDFNSVSMADRLKKLQDEIRALVSPTGGSSAEGLYTGGNADTEIVDLNDYMLNIPGFDQLRQFSEEIARFSLRPNTRSKVKILQDMESLTYELRLYHIGHINSPELSSGGAIQGSVKLGVNQYKDYSDSVRDGFRKIINIPENKRLRHFYISMFKLYLFLENTGVHPYKILNCSFIEQAMMVYLIDPRVFNESKQVYQVLHTIVSDSLNTSDQNSKKIGSRNGSNRNGSNRNRSSRNGSNRNNNGQQGGMSGGDGLILSEFLVRSLVARIENPSDDSNVFRLLQFSRDGTEAARAAVQRIIKTDAGYSNVFENIIHDYEKIFSNVVWYDNMGLGKLYTEIKRLNSVLPTMLEQVIRSRRKLYERTTVGIKRVIMQEEIYISALSNVIINHIYEPLKNACNDLDIIEGLLRLSTTEPPVPAAEAAAPPVPPVQALPPVNAPEIARKIAEVNNTVNTEIARGLPADVKNTVQQISVCVAKGVLQYIGRGEQSHTLLSDETNILDEISRNSGFSVVDSNIITAFDRYVSTPSEHASKISYTRIADIIRDEPNKISINNAANKTMMDNLALTSSIVCPNSSIVDAMGIFGSCAGTELPRETHNMGFTLTNSGRDYYYTGQSILKNNKLKIIYSSNINEFVLPYVQMEIDIKSTKFVTALSANTTFKSVLNKITDIWINFGKNNPTARPDEYWDKLFQNKTFFQELVSVGSLKSVGDLFQEINSTALNGSYMVPSTTAAEINNQLRIGIMGDRPSGVRAGFILYKAISGTHPKSIAGYFAADSNKAVVLATTAVIPSKGPAPSKKGPAPSKGPAIAAPAKSARKSAAASKAVEAPASKKTTTKRNRGEDNGKPSSKRTTAKKSAKSAK